LSLLLLNAGATVTVCNSQTKNLAKFTKRAEILISAVGQPDLISGAMVKKGAMVLDAGFSVIDGKVYGDVNFSQVSKKTRLITPTPGGIGPVTVALLLLNTVNAAEKLAS
jgi:methylenetetrahydrofolate dehydrogenase (NADP+)/methenyltetrahydrofolate cyclohydrolase